jgi:hypothetical protein
MGIVPFMWYNGIQRAIKPVMLFWAVVYNNMMDFGELRLFFCVY